MSPHLEIDVDAPDKVALLRQTVARSRALGVDVETNAMYAYRWRLCFVQIATEGEILIVDTLAPGVSTEPLVEPFADPSLRKVFHDAQGDLRILAREGIRVRNLFDTHRAATLLGIEKVGLGNLVEARFGVRLAKEHQTADFGRRPLPPELRAYVADDVRYLLPLAEELEREARKKGIWEELDLEFQRIAHEAAQPEPPPRLKLPSAARTPLGLAVAALVDRLRHREASGRDVPVGRVLANAALGEIAARKPRSVRDLSRIPGVKTSFVRAAGTELLVGIAELAEQDRRGELPPPPRPEGRPDPLRREREERLKAFRADAAAQRGVTPSVVLPTPVLDEIASRAPADLDELARIPWFGEKRLQLYGRAILDLLRSGRGR